MGQRAEGMITLGSQYYDAADASIDYEWAVTFAFTSQAYFLHHRLALCITGLIVRFHGKMGGEEIKLFRAVTFASQDTNYYAVVLTLL